MDTVGDVDQKLEHWRVRVRAARFDNDQGALCEAEMAIDELLDERLGVVPEQDCGE